MRKIKVGDEVVVLTGKDRGKTGKILKYYPIKGVVLVEGINLHHKAVRPTDNLPQGGIVKKEGPIHVSNVALKSPQTGRPSRVRIEKRDGKNVRALVRCGTVL